jgi:hypothetical protein
LQGGQNSGKSHHRLRQLPQRLVLATQGFQRIAPLTVPQLIQLPSYRILEAVDLGFQTWDPPDLPLHPQPVLQAYFIMNTRGKRGPWVGTWSATWSRCRWGHVDEAGQPLKSPVECHLVDNHGISQESVFKAGLECSPVHSSVFGAVGKVVKG